MPPITVPSIAPALISTVGIVTVPVKVGESIGAFKASEFVTVVAKFSSSPSAAANSFNVSRVAGAESTKLLIEVSTYVTVA